MLWIIKTADKVFEAETKRKIISKIVNYYGENGKNCYIESIFYEMNDGRTDELCRKGRRAIQDIIDDQVTAYHKEVACNIKGQKQIESEIRSMIYG